MRLKTLYYAIDERYPLLGRAIRRIHSGRILNTVSKRIRGKNNVIICKGAVLVSVLFDIRGDGNRIEIREDSFLNNVTFYVRGNHHRVFIGSNCRFSRGGSVWIEDSGCLLTIGEKTTFEDVHLALTEPGSRMAIGRNCMFANDIDVRTGDSHSLLSKATNERINYAKDTSISDHVWVAAHCIILKGSSIARDSVVATGSVVTGSFEEEGIVIAGNPAKKTKGGVTWSGARILRSG